MEMPGYFEKNIVLPPDYCGQTAELSPLAAFTLFQAIASEHAEYTGVGNDALAVDVEKAWQDLYDAMLALSRTADKSSLNRIPRKTESTMAPSVRYNCIRSERFTVSCMVFRCLRFLY